jgi:hypothetical protein
MLAKLPWNDSRIARIRSASRIVKLKSNEIIALRVAVAHSDQKFMRFLSSVITRKRHGWVNSSVSSYSGGNVMN